MSRYVREFTQKEKEEPKGKEEGASIDKRGLGYASSIVCTQIHTLGGHGCGI